MDLRFPLSLSRGVSVNQSGGLGIDLDSAVVGEGNLEAEADMGAGSVHPGPIQAGGAVGGLVNNDVPGGDAVVNPEDPDRKSLRLECSKRKLDKDQELSYNSSAWARRYSSASMFHRP